MLKVRALAAMLFAALVLCPAAHGQTLQICYENSAGACAIPPGEFWVQGGQDVCGVEFGVNDLMTAADGITAVWIDDSLPEATQQDMYDCEAAADRNPGTIFIGSYGDNGWTVTGTYERLAEWYPYYEQRLAAWSLYTEFDCPGSTAGTGGFSGRWAGFITQWNFGWGGAAPTGKQRDSEWWSAIGCIPAGQLEPMGVY